MVSPEQIESFLQGTDPQNYIVAIEAIYFGKPEVSVIVNDPETGKRIETHPFHPFLWFREEITQVMYGGKRQAIMDACQKHGIKIKKLRTHDDTGNIPERMENGFKFMATSKKSYNDLINFFREGGIDIRSEDFKPYFVIFSPVEQYMIQSGKRLFKGIEDYDKVHRLQFDIETEGLVPSKDPIFQIGIRDNRGFEQILETKGNTPQELRDSERENIAIFFKIIDILRPDIISGYNSESFDWTFFVKRCERLNIPIEDIAITLDPYVKIKRKDSMIKFGGEVENYQQTNMFGYNIIDISHSVRRAMAINSNIQSWSLKYVTKYSEIAKPNRVYVPGGKINTTWADTVNKYAFNDKNGQWYIISETKPLKEGFEEVTGAFIVQRYLLDDLWETEKVDTIFNQATFLIAKMLPTSYQRSSTMGTASQWKLIMAAWSYENELAIPLTQERRDFTGGLSRLLQVGYAKNVVKLDYAALYPKTELTHDIFPELDITGVMKGLLTYVVDTRDKFKFLTEETKGLVKDLEKKIKLGKTQELVDELLDKKALVGLYDKKQLPLKILANSWFGSYGASYIFNWGDVDCAEETTCCGRMYLRLMVKFFCDRYGYKPLVLDTDGVNFKVPDGIDSIKYTPNGSHWKTIKNKGIELSGTEAVLAEFNETYLRGRMGLDIDDILDSTINFSRKNYANSLGTKVKLVGNSIKSKKMPTYIEEFLNKGIRMLLDGKGFEFIEAYYEYVNKIYNYKIPLVKIASKAKVKTTLAEYKKKGKQKNKAGNPMPKQAHMELAIRENLDVNLGDVIYYVNVGTSKSHGDIKTVKDKKTGVTSMEMNCKLISTEMVESDSDAMKELEVLKKSLNDELDEAVKNEVENRIKEIETNLSTDEYNVAKYIHNFNKKIEPLLVCFKKEIRKKILIEIEKEKKTKILKLAQRSVFTHEQCVLSSGEPDEDADQDTYEELMTMEDKEIKFWLRVERVPITMNATEWKEIKEDYFVRMERQKAEGLLNEKYLLNEAIKRLEANEITDIKTKGLLPVSIFKIADIDPSGQPFLISRKWSEKLCQVDQLFLYENEAINRDKFYMENNCRDNEKRYDMWLSHKMEEIVLTGETTHYTIKPENDFLELTKLISEANANNKVEEPIEINAITENVETEDDDYEEQSVITSIEDDEWNF
jgi:DNA polymerase elongation subunit (family B)